MILFLSDVSERSDGALGNEDWDFMRAQIALALAVYHIGPVLRSLGRISRAVDGYGEEGNGATGAAGVKAQWKALEPWVYLVLHGVVGAELVWRGKGAFSGLM
jgi:hypothetical protein